MQFRVKTLKTQLHPHWVPRTSHRGDATTYVPAPRTTNVTNFRHTPPDLTLARRRAAVKHYTGPTPFTICSKTDTSCTTDLTLSVRGPHRRLVGRFLLKAAGGTAYSVDLDLTLPHYKVS